jgi:two-component system response regulator AtoC
LEEKIQILAPFNQTPVLIIGESGVGKEVVARRLHAMQLSPGPFVAINCSAIPHSLIESELFGHEKGAFTGSANTHKGVFEQANSGALLLDEIGDMPLAAQAKLLRVIQEKIVVRLGGEKDIPVNLRIICATNCDLQSKVECGEFREDLYYRINVIELNIPSLRMRQEDIIWLANQFLNLHSEQYSGNIKKLDALANQALLEYDWPGNVRELKNVIERACIMSTAPTIFAQDVFPQKTAFTCEDKNKTLETFLKSRERTYIDSKLRENNWNIMSTATRLGISRKSLWEKMKKYDLHKPSV